MKKLFLLSLIFVFCCLFQGTTMGQNLDQAKLINQLVGKWQAKVGLDTVEIWDFQKYGTQSYIVEINRKIKDYFIPVSFNSIYFNPVEGKFYGFTLLSNGGYGTWIGYFVSESKFYGDMVSNFNPQPVYGKFENTFTNPKEWTWRGQINEGINLPDLHFVRLE